MYLQQFDIKTTFLHEELDGVIYMQQPKRYKVPRIPNCVCKLNCSMASKADIKILELSFFSASIEET